MNFDISWLFKLSHCSILFPSEVLKTWRSVPVEGVDERKIEEYLKKHNITAMQNIEIKKVRFWEVKCSLIVIL